MIVRHFHKNHSLFLFAVILSLTVPIDVFAQTLGNGESLQAPIGRLVLGLLLGIILVFASVLFLRKNKEFSGSGANSALFWAKRYGSNAKIHIRETKRMNQYADIVLIENNNKEFLVLVSAHQFLVLSEDEIKNVDPDFDGGTQ